MQLAVAAAWKIQGRVEAIEELGTDLHEHFEERK